MNESIHLTELEAAAVAYRLIAQQVGDVESWLYWEDVGYLDEASFEMVEEQVRKVAVSTLAKSRSLDIANHIDSADILERAQG